MQVGHDVVSLDEVESNNNRLLSLPTSPGTPNPVSLRLRGWPGAKQIQEKRPRRGSTRNAGDRVVATNRRGPLTTNEIIETLECGIMLSGSEVKSLRGGKAPIARKLRPLRRPGTVGLYQECSASPVGLPPPASAATIPTVVASSSAPARSSL